MPAFSYLLMLCLSAAFGWTEAQTIAFPLIVSLPFAYVMVFAEQRQRNLQKNAYGIILTQARKPSALGLLPGGLILVSALQLFAFGLALFAASFAGLYLLFSFEAVHAFFPSSLPVNWAVLYIMAALGSLLALRIRRAYLVFALSMACAVLLGRFL